MEFLSKFNPLTADYRKKEPLSIKAIKGATALTPIDSVVEISKELKKEEPDYKKIGLLTAMEAAGLVAPMAKPTMTAIKSSKAAQPFKKTRKAYRIATQAEDGKLYPLFVNADDEIPIGQWISASIPPITFKGKNGNMYVPSKGAKRSKGEKAKPTGDMQVLPDQETADQLREAGFAVEKPSKSAPFGKVRAVASRPGYHATTKPVAHHLGPEDLVISEAEKKKLVKAGITPKAFKEKTFNYLDGKLISKKKIDDLSEKEKKRVTKQKKFYVKRRAEDQVFLEVEMADDTSEELLKYMKARGRTDINDKLPEGGSYTYQDGQADAETWVVGGDMKVNRVLDRDEALTIQKEMGVKDLPLRSEVENILGRNFSNGGLTEKGMDMYQGQDDSLLVEGIGMARGGLPEQMEMNFGTPDNTVGVDPVSGNEVPLGSMPEEVRDDIPAQLSEGEYVVPADVVRFWGVKLFEDLRKQAKMGFAQMDADGRIGGEPIPAMKDESGLGLELSDLEIITMEEEPEEAFLGKFFAGLTGSNKQEQQKDDEPRDMSFSAIKKRAEQNANTPKFRNRAEEMLYNLRNKKDDDERKGSGAKIDFGFRGNPMERGARKYGDKSDEQDSGQAQEGYTGQNLRSDESFGQRFMKGLGFDEGGIVDMPDVKGASGAIDYDVSLGGGLDPNRTRVEAREYQNDAGHKIIIMFEIDMKGNATPVTPIPEGYYPVGSQPVAVTGAETGGQASGGSSDDDDDDGPAVEPFNYEELTIDELTDEVKNLSSNKGDLITAGAGILGTPIFAGIVKLAEKRHENKTIQEIERRLENSDLAIYEREYLENLLEVAKAPNRTLIQKAFDKLTGKEVEEPDLPELDGPTYDELPSIKEIGEAQVVEKVEGYTPELEAPAVTSGYGPEIMEQVEKASKEAAEIAFSGYEPKEDDDKPGVTVAPEDNANLIASVIEDPTSFLPPTQQDDDDDEPTFSPAPPSNTGGYDPVGGGSVDDPGRQDLTGLGYINKGGLIQKKKATKKKKKSK